ncbi:hypothetical protein [Flavonifractor plautii]|uniref:hypothetical protein n=1 Tax=Flavonifractor plautii TaxID=292800 RepID=UPI003EF03051
MKRRNTMTAAVFLLAVSAGFLLLATSFFGGEGKFEALLKTFLRERDVMAFVDGAETAVNGDLNGITCLFSSTAGCSGSPAAGWWRTRWGRIPWCGCPPAG